MKPKVPPKPTPIKHCAYCGRLMERNRYINGTLEAITTFQRRMYCGRWCREEASKTDGLVRPLAAMRRRRHRKRSDGFLGAEKVRAAYKLYEAGYSVRTIAHAGWETWGYANAKVAERTLAKMFEIEGLPLRPRGFDRRHTSCSACGCLAQERTPGCRRCRDRHDKRRRAGLPNSPITTCSGCGCLFDERTRGCRTCTYRHWERKKRAALPEERAA